ncbi:MAG: LptA/OstA family protein, partial [Pseudomonadota bacterium]
MTATALASGLAFPAVAQNAVDQLTAPAEEIADEIADNPSVDFAADTLGYDEATDIVTADGNVVVVRGGYRLNADRVVYERKTGLVTASGNVNVIDPDGNEIFATEVALTDELKDGAVEGFLLVLQDGGRLAAADGTRVDGVSKLNRAVYSPCDVVDSTGCPKRPLWALKSSRVTHDPVAGRVRYADARLELFGVPVLILPGLSHSDSSEARASGLLVPSARIDRSTGVSVSQPYFIDIDDNRDLTLTPTVFTEVNPGLGIDYRQLTSDGPFQVGGFITVSDVEETLIAGPAPTEIEDEFR